MSSSVEVVGLKKFFGAMIAVDNISFTIPEGSFFSLLGPSGCGKSTTLRMLSGFEHPDEGRIIIAGCDMSGVPPYSRPTNIVFQRWALFPHMTALQNVAFGLEAEGVERAEIRRRSYAVLEMVGLQGFADRKPGSLSGGQMQRVALARALVKKPAVLLLDEPMSALDLKLRHQMQIELKRIQREVGTTFVFVTHDQGEALTMSDEIAVMNAGRIEQIASPQELYNQPATRFVAGFIGNANVIPIEILEVSEGRAVGHLDGTPVKGVAVGDLIPGAGGSMVVRFERVRILPAGGAGIAATVRQMIFSGATIQYLVAIDGSNVEVTVERPHTGSDAVFNAGDRVHLNWEADDVRIFGA